MAKLRTNRGSQLPLVATFEFSVTDTMDNTSGAETNLNAAGVFEISNLPQGAVVTGGEVIVETASNDTTTHTLDVGDATTADRYTAAPVDLKTAARTALTLTGYSHDTGENIRMTLTPGTGDATAGTVRINVMYIVEGRVNEVQTH